VVTLNVQAKAWTYLRSKGNGKGGSVNIPHLRIEIWGTRAFVVSPGEQATATAKAKAEAFLVERFDLYW
jgi:hypothetical protein